MQVLITMPSHDRHGNSNRRELHTSDKANELISQSSGICKGI